MALKLIDEEKLDGLLQVYRDASSEATRNTDASSMIVWSAHIAAINDVKKALQPLPEQQPSIEQDELWKEVNHKIECLPSKIIPENTWDDTKLIVLRKPLIYREDVLTTIEELKKQFTITKKP